MVKMIFVIITFICLLWVFGPPDPIGWRFHYNETFKEFHYPRDFVDQEVLKYHPKYYKEFWKAHGVEDWDWVERIYEKD